MSEKISLIFPNQKLNYKKLSDLTIHDIGMDGIITRLSKEKNEQTYIANVMRLMTDDAENARYRSDVFHDIFRNKKMREEMMELLDRINFLREYGSYKHEHDHDPSVWDLLHRLEEINDYIECIDAIHSCLEKADISSKGLNNLKEYVGKLYEDNGFEGLRKDIRELRADTQNLKSITVGINLNERFEACGIGVISINNKPFSKSMVVKHFIDKVNPRDSIHEGIDWDGDYRFDQFSAKNPKAEGTKFIPPMFSPLAMMSLMNVSEADERTRTITNYMDEITDRMLSNMTKHLRSVLSKYTMMTITDVTDLMPEFIYYIRWAEYIEREQEKGAVFCKPEVLQSPASGKKDALGESDGQKACKSNDKISMNAEGIYNIKLIGDASRDYENDIVKNNLDFSDEHNLYILTGANRGGKTTITQTIGQLFFIAQGGIYVPGTKFEYTPLDAIYTHFPADEDKTMDLGRLGEECKRFREIFSESTDKSLLLLNETFSTTSFEEGYYIAKDCVKAILSKGTRTIYNTHMHKLALDIDEINEGMGPKKSASLIVKSEEGKRSYEVAVAPPVGMSYARDIAEKYGVTYEELTEGFHM